MLRAASDVNELPFWWRMRLGWIAGARSIAALSAGSKDWYVALEPLLAPDKCWLLHSVNRAAPLGDFQCEVPVMWLFMVLHRTADNHPTAPTFEGDTLISWCCNCRRLITHWFYMCTRYRYAGQLEGAIRIQSETNAAESDSDA